MSEQSEREQLDLTSAPFTEEQREWLQRLTQWVKPPPVREESQPQSEGPSASRSSQPEGGAPQAPGELTESERLAREFACGLNGTRGPTWGLAATPGQRKQGRQSHTMASGHAYAGETGASGLRWSAFDDCGGDMASGRTYARLRGPVASHNNRQCARLADVASGLETNNSVRA